MNVIGLQTFVAREVQRFMRIAIQTLISPWISALLYIFIFGSVVGSNISDINGVEYIAFVMPGIVMLNLISASFSQTSSSLFFQRFAKFIEEILVAPLSHVEIILGYVLGGIARGFAVGAGVYALAILFGGASIDNIALFIGYSLAVAVIFSLLGLIVGLWAESFEQLSILNTFVITPLVFLGGVFNSITMLPEPMQTAVKFNPFFYFVDGLRFAMIGVSEANTTVGLIIISGCIILLSIIVWELFKRGWKIRT